MTRRRRNRAPGPPFDTIELPPGELELRPASTGHGRVRWHTAAGDAVGPELDGPEQAQAWRRLMTVPVEPMPPEPPAPGPPSPF